MNSNDISNINNLYSMLNQRELLKQKLKEWKNEKEYLEEIIYIYKINKDIFTSERWNISF